MFTILLVLLSLIGCTTQENDQAYIELGVPNNLTHTSLQARSSLQSVNELDVLIISISSSTGKIIKEFDLLQFTDSVKIGVPVDTALVITAEGKIDNTIKYRGKTTAGPLKRDRNSAIFP